MKRSTAGFLACLLLAVALVSCGRSTPAATGAVTDAASPSPAITTPPESTEITDDLPKLDYNGRSFSILIGDVHGGTTTPTYFREEQTGEIVADAVWARNAAVAERLNVALDWEVLNFEYSSRANWATRIKSIVMAKEKTDLICGPGYYTTNLVTEDLFINLNGLPYLDFQKPWWSTMYMDNVRINDKLYFALGEFSLNKLQLAYCLYFNKELFDAAKIPYPYSTVIDGKWTLDTMSALIKDTYRDVNGDGTRDAEDSYGMVSENVNQLWAFMDPMGVKVFDKDAQGNVTFVMDNQHNADVIEKLLALWTNTGDTFHHNVVQDANDVSRSMFINGNSFISTGDIIKTEAYRDLDFEYGILPYPKWDDAQEDYVTRTSSAISVFCIPVSASAPEVTAAVLEAMNYESYRTVIPAYYEAALKMKYARDQETVQVLDIIRGSISMQFIDAYSSVFSGYSEIFRKTLVDHTETWSSDVAGIRQSAQAKLDDLLAWYKKNG